MISHVHELTTSFCLSHALSKLYSFCLVCALCQFKCVCFSKIRNLNEDTKKKLSGLGFRVDDVSFLIQETGFSSETYCYWFVEDDRPVRGL